MKFTYILIKILVIPFEKKLQLLWWEWGCFKYGLSFNISHTFFIFTASLFLVYVVVINFAKFYVERLNFKYFSRLIIGFISRILLLAFRDSFVILVFAWEGLGVFSYLLVLFYYNWNRIQGANLTLLTNRVGDFFLFITIPAYAGEVKIFFLGLLFMLITKRAMYPFRSWLPAAMAAPTPVSAMVHSRTLVVAGLLLLFKFKIIFSLRFFIFFFNILGLTTILLGSCSALVAEDIKKLVAFSTLSQLGLILITFSCFYLYYRIHYLILHAFLKRYLFILVGHSILVCNRQNITYIKRRLWNFTLLALLVFVLRNFMSIIFTTLFIAKEIFLFKIFSFINQTINSLLFFFTALTTMLYSLRLLLYFFKKKIINLKLFRNTYTYKIILLIIIYIIPIFIGKALTWTILSKPSINTRFRLLIIIRIFFIVFKIYEIYYFAPKLILINKILNLWWNFIGFKSFNLEHVLIIRNSLFNLKNKKYWLFLLARSCFIL